VPHPKNKTPPNLQDLLRQWFYQRFGLRGLLILAVVSASFFLWWNWEKVRALPGVSAILSQLSRQSLPEADPNRFSIAIAHLENDKDRQHENLVVESLKEFKGVQVLRLDRTISLEGAVPEETEKAGHDKAREYLQATGADVLIWGLVVAHAGRTIPKLYWTVGRDRTQRGRSQRYSPAEDLRLPEIFWQDLVEVLRLLIVSHHSEFGEQEGRYLADKIRPFIAKVRHIVETGHVEKGWRPEDLVLTKFILANSLTALGNQAGDQAPLKEATDLYRSILKEFRRERVPQAWATAQNNLGNALSILGEREASTDQLKEAVAAYREAFKERTRERVPLHWAETQNNLGNALQILGNRLRDDGLLCEALGLHAGAWKVWSDAGHFYAKWAVGAVDDTLKRFKSDFGPQAFRPCLQKDQHLSELLRKMGKTS
jgi:hypothetical protein